MTRARAGAWDLPGNTLGIIAGRMPQSIKTAVSLRRELFEQSEALASRMRVSHSRLVAMALEEFLRRRQNRELLDQINAAYEDQARPSERKLLARMRRQHRRLLEGDY